MDKPTFRRQMFLAPLLLVLAGVMPCLADQTVMLHAGSIIDADAVSREGDNYRLSLPTLPNDTLLIPATEVLCVGDACRLADSTPTPPQTAASPKTKPSGPRLTGKIEIHGSNTIGERLMPALIEAFGAAAGYEVEAESSVEKNEESSYALRIPGDQTSPAVIDLFAHGSHTAIDAMIDRKATIGMRSSPISTEDVEKVKRAGFADFKDPASEHVLAMDGIAVIVNHDNVVGALRPDEIAKIFSGKISDWSEVGGLPGPINLYRRDDKSGTTDTFNTLVMTPSKEKITFSATPFEDSDQLVDRVAGDRNGIGYVGWGYVRNKAHALSIVSSCGVPMKPSVFAIKTEEYPLTRRLFLYTNGQPADQITSRLLNFALSDDAFKTIEKNGFISRSNSFLRFDEQVQRLLQVALAADPSPSDTRNFVRDVQSAKRTSITFHFQPGGTELESQSIDDLNRLAKILSDNSYQNLRFIVAGFTSEKEVPLAQQAALSAKRANEVAKTLFNRGAKFNAQNLLVKGYSAGAPVACNTTDHEQGLNRRVEVWVVDDSKISRQM